MQIALNGEVLDACRCPVYVHRLPIGARKIDRDRVVLSGVGDCKCEHDQDCLNRIQSIVGKMGGKPTLPFNRTKPAKPKLSPKDIYGIFSSNGYDVKDVIKRLVDDSEFDEYKALYGKSIVTGYARIDGCSVGIVAN